MSQRLFNVNNQSRCVVVDPFWSSVVLLAINDNKADGTTSFDDQSDSNHTLTAVGNAQYDTAQAPAGLTSTLLLDGSGDYVGITTANVLEDMVSNANVIKTIEVWARATAIAHSNELWNRPALLSKGNVYANFSVVDSGELLFYWYDGATKEVISSGAGITTSVFYHFAADFNGSGGLTLYKNGTSIASGTFTGLHSGASGGVELIGANASAMPSQYWNGHLGAMRVTNARRYTGNFTPPPLPLGVI